MATELWQRQFSSEVGRYFNILTGLDSTGLDLRVTGTRKSPNRNRVSDARLKAFLGEGVNEIALGGLSPDLLGNKPKTISGNVVPSSVTILPGSPHETQQNGYLQVLSDIHPNWGRLDPIKNALNGSTNGLSFAAAGVAMAMAGAINPRTNMIDSTSMNEALTKFFAPFQSSAGMGAASGGYNEMASSFVVAPSAHHIEEHKHPSESMLLSTMNSPETGYSSGRYVDANQYSAVAGIFNAAGAMFSESKANKIHSTTRRTLRARLSLGEGPKNMGVWGQTEREIPDELAGPGQSIIPTFRGTGYSVGRNALVLAFGAGNSFAEKLGLGQGRGIGSTNIMSQGAAAEARYATYELPVDADLTTAKLHQNSVPEKFVDKVAVNFRRAAGRLMGGNNEKVVSFGDGSRSVDAPESGFILRQQKNGEFLVGDARAASRQFASLLLRGNALDVKEGGKTYQYNEDTLAAEISNAGRSGGLSKNLRNAVRKQWADAANPFGHLGLILPGDESINRGKGHHTNQLVYEERGIGPGYSQKSGFTKLGLAYDERVGNLPNDTIVAYAGDINKGPGLLAARVAFHREALAANPAYQGLLSSWQEEYRSLTRPGLRSPEGLAPLLEAFHQKIQTQLFPMLDQLDAQTLAKYGKKQRRAIEAMVGEGAKPLFATLAPPSTEFAASTRMTVADFRKGVEAGVITASQQQAYLTELANSPHMRAMRAYSEMTDMNSAVQTVTPAAGSVPLLKAGLDSSITTDTYSHPLDRYDAIVRQLKELDKARGGKGPSLEDAVTIGFETPSGTVYVPGPRGMSLVKESKLSMSAWANILASGGDLDTLSRMSPQIKEDLLRSTSTDESVKELGKAHVPGLFNTYTSNPELEPSEIRFGREWLEQMERRSGGRLAGKQAKQIVGGIKSETDIGDINALRYPALQAAVPLTAMYDPKHRGMAEVHPYFELINVGDADLDPVAFFFGGLRGKGKSLSPQERTDRNLAVTRRAFATLAAIGGNDATRAYLASNPRNGRGDQEYLDDILKGPNAFNPMIGGKEQNVIVERRKNPGGTIDDQLRSHLGLVTTQQIRNAPDKKESMGIYNLVEATKHNMLTGAIDAAFGNSLSDITSLSGEKASGQLKLGLSAWYQHALDMLQMPASLSSKSGLYERFQYAAIGSAQTQNLGTMVANVASSMIMSKDTNPGNKGWAHSEEEIAALTTGAVYDKSGKLDVGGTATAMQKMVTAIKRQRAGVQGANDEVSMLTGATSTIGRTLGESIAVSYAQKLRNGDIRENPNAPGQFEMRMQREGKLAKDGTMTYESTWVPVSDSLKTIVATHKDNANTQLLRHAQGGVKEAISSMGEVLGSTPIGKLLTGIAGVLPASGPNRPTTPDVVSGGQAPSVAAAAKTVATNAPASDLSIMKVKRATPIDTSMEKIISYDAETVFDSRQDIKSNKKVEPGAWEASAVEINAGAIGAGTTKRFGIGWWQEKVLKTAADLAKRVENFNPGGIVNPRWDTEENPFYTMSRAKKNNRLSPDDERIVMSQGSPDEAAKFVQGVVGTNWSQGHNVLGYDAKLFGIDPKKTIDTLVTEQILSDDKNTKGKKLVNVANKYGMGVTEDALHGSLVDSKTSAEVLLRQAQSVAGFKDEELQWLSEQEYESKDSSHKGVGGFGKAAQNFFKYARYIKNLKGIQDSPEDERKAKLGTIMASMKRQTASQQTAQAASAAMAGGQLAAQGSGSGGTGGGGGGGGGTPSPASSSSSGSGSMSRKEMDAFLSATNKISGYMGTAAFQLTDVAGILRENGARAFHRNEAVWGTSDQLANNLTGLSNPSISGSPSSVGPSGEMRGTILARYASAMEVLNNPLASAAARETAANRLQTIRFGATVQGYLGTLDNSPGVTHGLMQKTDANLMAQIQAGRQAAQEIREGSGPGHEQYVKARADAKAAMSSDEFKQNIGRIGNIVLGPDGGKSFGFDKLGEAHENYVKAVKHLTATVNTVRAKIESGEALSPEEKLGLKAALVGESVAGKQYKRAQGIAQDALERHAKGGKGAADVLGMVEEEHLQSIRDEADESKGLASRATTSVSGAPKESKNSLRWGRLMSGFYMFQLAREWRMTVAPAFADTQKEVEERTRLGGQLSTWQTNQSSLGETFGGGYRAVQQWQAARDVLEGHRYSMGSGLAAAAAYAAGGNPKDLMSNPLVGGVSSGGGLGLALGLGTAMTLNTMQVGAAVSGPIALAVGAGAAGLGAASFVAGHFGDTTSRAGEILAGYRQGAPAGANLLASLMQARGGTDLAKFSPIQIPGGKVRLGIGDILASNYGDMFEPEGGSAGPLDFLGPLLAIPTLGMANEGYKMGRRQNSIIKQREFGVGSQVMAAFTAATKDPYGNGLWSRAGIISPDIRAETLSAAYQSGITNLEGRADEIEAFWANPRGQGFGIQEIAETNAMLGQMSVPWAASPGQYASQTLSTLSANLVPYGQRKQIGLDYQRRGAEANVSRYIGMGFSQSAATAMAKDDSFTFGSSTEALSRLANGAAFGASLMAVGISAQDAYGFEQKMQDPLAMANITGLEMAAGQAFLSGDRNLQARAFQQGMMLPGANWRGAVSTDITTGGGPIGRNSLFGMTKNMLREDSFVKELGGSRLAAGWTTQTIRADLNQNLQLPHGFQWTDEDVQAMQGESFGGMYGQAGLQELYARKNYASQLASIGVQGEKLRLNRQFELNVTRPQRDFQLALQGATQFGGTVGGYEFTGAFNFQAQQLAFEQRGLDIQRARSNVQFGWQGFDLSKQHMRAQMGFDWSAQEAQLGRQGQLLGRGMQQYEFGYQHTSLELGHKYFGEDWALSQQKRFLSFGWQMEDSERNIRRSTGFEKQQLIRERGRAVEMFGLDQTQAGREKSREEEKFKREEEHLKKQMDQFKKQSALEDQRWQIEQDRLTKSREWERQDFDTEMSRLAIKKSWADEDFAREQEALDRKKQQYEDDRKAAELSYAKEQERWAKEKEFSDAQYELSLKELGVQADQIKNAEELRVKMLEFEKQREQADMENARRMEEYLNLFFQGLMRKVGQEWNNLFKFGPTIPGTNTGAGGTGSGTGSGQGNTTGGAGGAGGAGGTGGSGGAPPIPIKGKEEKPRDTVSSTMTVHAPAQNNTANKTTNQPVQLILDGKVVAETVIKLAGPALNRDSRRTLGIG